MRTLRIGRWLAASSLTLLLVACGGDGSRDGTTPTGEAPPPTTPETPTPPTPTTPTVPANQVSAAGGVVEITDPASPIRGTRVAVPAGAVASGTVDITIGYEDNPPAALSADAVSGGAAVLGKTYVITKNVPGTFDQPIEVTVPYSAAGLEAADVPSVLFYDESAGAYAAMAVSGFDPVAGTVTFRTAHFSKYIVAGMKGLGARLTAAGGATGSGTGASLTVDTGFLPSKDSFFRSNISSYSSPGGNSLGMAAYADWFYERAKTPQNNNVGLFSTYIEGDPANLDDDVTAEELIVRAHAMSSPQWASRLARRQSNLSSLQTAIGLLQNLWLTGKPQVFLMWGNPTWSPQYVAGTASWSQAMVAYKFDVATLTFGLYDPNLRGDDTLGIGVNATGFTTLTKQGLFSPEPNVFAYDSYQSIYAPSDMQALYDGAKAGWSDGLFGRIQISNLGFDVSGRTALVTDRTNVRLVGSVALGTGNASATPDAIDVYVAGSFVGRFPLAGTAFDILLPTLPNTTSAEILMIASRQAGVGRSSSGVYGTFKRFKIKSGSVLDNWGFEKGDFSLWTSVRRLWGGGDVVNPSDKSVIATPGFDEIATTIPRVLFGSYSARVNNSDNNLHISTITRDVLVPAGSAPFALSFSWAAVLEDPQHAPDEQPYVNIKVENTTTGEVLYQRHYFANDPSWPGWQSFQSGNWKAIDWQAVNVTNLERFAGNTIRVTVEAADCSLSGHGGYAYYDADE